MRHWNHSIICAFVRRWLQPLSLSPTTEASKYHSCVCTCKFNNGRDMRIDSVWQSGAGKSARRELSLFKPTYPPVPEKLLQVIRSNCQTNCSSLRCTAGRITSTVLMHMETAGDLDVQTYHRLDVMRKKMMTLFRSKFTKCPNRNVICVVNIYILKCSCSCFCSVTIKLCPGKK